jgi:hypothetical protein
LADEMIETKVCTSKVDAIPAPFSLVFNVFLELIIFDMDMKILSLIGRYVEI